jgi:CP family cyanate transporter-like MFS transporter
MQSGYNAQLSNTLLALITVGQTGGAFLLPILAKHEDWRKLLMLALILQLIGFCDFIWLPQKVLLVWAICCGVHIFHRAGCLSCLAFRQKKPKIK